MVMDEALSSMNGLSGMLAELGGGSVPIVIAIAAGLIVFALFSYKIYNIALFLIGAAAGGVPSFMYLAPLLQDAFEIYEDWFPIVVALVGALLGVAIIKALQKLAIFIAGAALGYFLGGFINNAVAASGENEFLATMPGSIIIPIVAAVIVGILAGKMFRPVFIIGTALVSSLAAVSLIFGVYFGGLTVIGLIIGIVLGAGASIFQFKTTSKNHHEKK